MAQEDFNGLVNKLEDARLGVIRALHQAEVNKPADPRFFIREYLRHDEGFPDLAGHQDYSEALRALEDNLSSSMQTLLGVEQLAGIAVFFLPETNQDLPLFFGNTALWTADRLRTKEDMRNGIREIGVILRKEWPRPDTELTERHFFVWARRIFDICKVGTTIQPNEGVYVSGSTIAVYPKQSPNDREYSVSANARLLTWKPIQNYPPFIATPVHVDADVYVLVATFFPDITKEAFERTIKAHALAAYHVFTPVFQMILNESRQMLRKNLARDLIEPSILSYAASHLRTEKGAFTFSWRGKGNKEWDCSDLALVIGNELETNPRDLFELVIDLQQAMYQKLRSDWDDNNASLVALGFTQINFLPEEMPFAGTLKDLERAQRALGQATRDHVVHQFQVCLLGLFLMNKCEDELLKMASADFCPVAQDDTAIREALRYLLRLSWFLASNFHDIGYPIEKVTDIVKSLHAETAQLLHLNPRLLMSPPVFSIESVLYDEPRTYILAQHLATCLGTIIGVGEKEAWYFLRNCLFFQREHAAISAVVLGLSLLPKDTETAELHEFLNNTKFGHLITHYILLPILMHHAGEWGVYAKRRLQTALNACEDELQHGKEVSRVITSEKEKTNRIKEELSALFQPLDDDKQLREDNKSPPNAKYTISFRKSPLGNILGYCDNIQEDGRPLGVAASGLDWGVGIRGILDKCDKVPTNIKYKVIFSGKDQGWKKAEIGRAKIVFDWKEIPGIFCTVFYETPELETHFENITFSEKHNCLICPYHE
jgi:hypothetical protein